MCSPFLIENDFSAVNHNVHSIRGTYNRIVKAFDKTHSDRATLIEQIAELLFVLNYKRYWRQMTMYRMSEHT